MNILTLTLRILGLLAIAMGLLWCGQGLGIIRWPANSFMIDLSIWTTRGVILVGIGIFIMLLPRWINRRR